MEWVEVIRTAISFVEDHLEDDCLTTESVADAVHIPSSERLTGSCRDTMTVFATRSGSSQ